VNPTLGVITLAASLAIRRPGNPPRWAQLLLTLAAVASVYAFEWIEAPFGLWPSAGLDFSVHTGVHVAIVVSLWMIDRRAGMAATVIALLYGALMIHQEYHSLADVATTALVIAPLTWGIWWAGRRLAR
jgi:hypothetical protein